MLSCYLAKTNSDFKFIASLYNNPKNNRYLRTKKTNFKEIKKRLALPNRKMYILVTDNKKIGYFNLHIAVSGKKVMFGIIIDKPFQSKGYGRQAMKLIEQEAKKLGVKKISLEVFEKNIRAVRLYKKTGYKRIDRLFMMEKRI